MYGLSYSYGRGVYMIYMKDISSQKDILPWLTVAHMIISQQETQNTVYGFRIYFKFFKFLECYQKHISAIWLKFWSEFSVEYPISKVIKTTVWWTQATIDFMWNFGETLVADWSYLLSKINIIYPSAEHSHCACHNNSSYCFVHKLHIIVKWWLIWTLFLHLFHTCSCRCSAWYWHSNQAYI